MGEAHRDADRRVRPAWNDERISPPGRPEDERGLRGAPCVGRTIPGLFAAGRCTAGVCAGGYASGASLGDGSFFGRRAGIGAARGPVDGD